jgi:hypothetical protein
MGVTWDDEEVSRLPNGDYAVCCTSCAERIIELAEAAFGVRGEIFGWDAGANPTSVVAGPTHGARLKAGQGHDFAIIDGRYLVDAWAKNVEMSSDRAAFDLNEPADRARVLKLFGNPRTWTRRIEHQLGEFSWVPAMPSQFSALARSS